MAKSEVEVHAAAFVVTLLKSGELEAAEDFVEWYVDTFGESDRLESLIYAED